MLKEFHKLFQTRFPTHLCHFCIGVLCVSQDLMLLPPIPTEEYRNVTGFGLALQTGTLWSAGRLLSVLWLPGISPWWDTEGDAAAVSVSTVNPPSASRNKCTPSLPPRAAPGDGYTGGSGPLIKAPTAFASKKTPVFRHQNSLPKAKFPVGILYLVLLQHLICCLTAASHANAGCSVSVGWRAWEVLWDR